MVTFLITLILNQIWGILAGMIVAFFIHYRLAGFSFKKWFSYIKNPQILVEKKIGRPLSLQLKGFINSIHLPKIEKICNELDHSIDLEIDLAQATFIDATVMDYLRDQETKSKNNKEKTIHFANDIPTKGMYVAR